MTILGGLGFVVGTAASGSMSKNSTPDSGYAMLLAVPAFALFTISAIAIPVSLVEEKANEKSIKNGWRFLIVN